MIYGLRVVNDHPLLVIFITSHNNLCPPRRLAGFNNSFVEQALYFGINKINFLSSELYFCDLVAIGWMLAVRLVKRSGGSTFSVVRPQTTRGAAPDHHDGS